MKQYQLRLHGLSLSITEAEQEMTLLKEKAAAALGLPPSALLCVKLNRKSLDSRDKQDLRFVYALDVTCTAKAMPKSRKRGITADPSPISRCRRWSRGARRCCIRPLWWAQGRPASLPP